ncbi:hypothetical protein KPATCC21470_0913 [Kitasatospora purpeofusca]
MRAGAPVGEVAPFIERGLVVPALGQDSIDQFPGLVLVVVDSEVLDQVCGEAPWTAKAFRDAAGTPQESVTG